MATVIERPRLRLRRLCLGVFAGLLAALLPAAIAHAASAGSPHTQGRSVHGAAGPATRAPSPQSRAGALAQMTGLTAAQVTASAACPPASAGRVRCAAQALLVRSSHRPVRPLVRPRRSFTQIFPRVARGVAPASAAAAATAGAPPQAGTPAYLQQAYDLSYLSQTGGIADTVAIVDAYDSASAEADLARYRATYGLPPCTTANGCFQKVNQSGASGPLPGADSGWEMEISLDLDAVSALCPNCHIVLVEARSTSIADMNQAEATAARLGARQISNSWAGVSGTPIPGTYTFPGVAVIAATGDSGYVGPGQDAYPAAFPGVTAAGGTTLTASTAAAPTARGFSESAWSLSGGWGGGSGCDVQEAKPAYQTDTGCRGRSYSDVSAVGDPSTGLMVYDSGNGGWMLVGGTSLATPLIAAYDAITGVNGATPQWAYSNSASLNDPATGSTGACAAAIAYICNAGVGFDGPTGAGSISGAIVPGAPGIAGPSIGSGDANTYTQSVTATGATLTGGVYGNSLATTYWWQYGATTAYGQQTAAASIGPGSAPVSVTTSLTGLAPGTTYHYRLVAQNGDGTSYGYDFSLTTGTSAPIGTAPPVITGGAREGQVLTASSGVWTPAGTYAYQWQRSVSGGSAGANIPGATGASYTPVAADVGARIDVIVTATNGYGTAAIVSAPVGPVLSGAPSATGAPVISGSARQGQVLRATSGAWSPGGGSSYQWQRSTNGGGSWAKIAGATRSAYTLAAADVGARIDVVVTATNGYGTAAAASAPVGPVAAATRPRAAAAKSVSSASAVLSVGRRVLRNSKGTRFAVAQATLVAAARDAVRRGANSPAPVRLVVVQRAGGVRGGLRAWVCAAPTGSAALGACTGRVQLRSATTFRLPRGMRGDVVVIVARTGRRAR